MQNKKYIFIALVALATLSMGIPALAATDTATITGTVSVLGDRKGGDIMNRGNMKPAIFGTVTAVNANIITVNSVNRMMPRTNKQQTTTPISTTYTVDATNATITKNNLTGTIASITVGDTIMAQGTLTGTNLVATTIRDGVMMRKAPAGTDNNSQNSNTQTYPIAGNGQPVVAGKIVTINGSILTITNKSNVTYTVDTTNAKIVQDQKTITIANITLGDNVVVQGTVNGNTITASSVIDQKTTNTGTNTQPSKGFFGSIGSFFSHLFGF